MRNKRIINILLLNSYDLGLNCTKDGELINGTFNSLGTCKFNISTQKTRDLLRDRA